MKKTMSLIFRIAILCVTIVAVFGSYSNASAVAPTISDILDQTTAEDTSTGPINFTVGDDVTPVGSLIVTGSSSDTTLVPNGNIVIEGSDENRTVAITPANNQFGNTTITITVDDGSETANDTFNLEVTAVNDPPTISDIPNQTTNEDTSTGAINFTVGDIETAAGSLNVSGSSSNTTLVPNANIVFGGSGADRTVTITPANNQFGNTTITITVNDGSETANDTFNLEVTAVNDPPTADNKNPSTNEDISINITLSGSDVDNCSLTFEILTDPSHGSLDAISDLACTPGTPNIDTATIGYTPDENYFGSDSFTYRVNDGTTNSNTATVSITISAVNDDPIADNKNVATNEDTPLDISLSGSDIETCDLTFELVVMPSNGNLSTITDAPCTTGAPNTDTATVTYTPIDDFNGSDSFTYKVNDGSVDSNIATVSINVVAVNDPPTLVNIPKTGPEDTDITFTTTNFTDAFTDVDAGDELVHVQIRSLPANGTLKLNTTPVNVNDVIPAASLGNLIFTPNLNFEGNTSFEWNGSDGQAYALANALVNITIDNLNDPPTISNIPDQTTNEDTTLGPIAFTVNDVETNPGSLLLTKSSSNIALVPLANIVFGGTGSNRTVTITPTVNLSGSAVITINVSDGAIITSDTFNLTVNPVNDAPSFVKGANQTVDEDSGPITVINWATGISAGPADEAGQTLTFQVTNDNSALFSAQPSVSVTGTLSFTPAVDKNGSAIVSVTLKDNGGTAFGGMDTSAAQSFTITINPVNDAPLALEDTYSVMVGEILSEPAPGVLENDQDFDDDPLSAQLESGPGSGALTLNANGSFTYTPAVGFTGVVSFTYQASDSVELSNVAAVQIEVFDGTQPRVEFTAPVQSGDTYDVYNQSVCFKVVVEDDIGIDYVHYYWWDKIEEEYIDFDDAEDAPFDLCVSTRDLRIGFNQVFAEAYDGSGNVSARKWIWLYKVGDIWAIHFPLVTR